MVESKKDSRKIIFEKLLEAYKGTDGKGNHKAKFLKAVDQLIENGQLDKSFYGKFKDVPPTLISKIKIKEALDEDDNQNKIEGNLKLVSKPKQQKKQGEESEQEELSEQDKTSQQTIAFTEDQKRLNEQLKKATRGQSPAGKLISEEKQQRRKQKEVFQQETQQKLQEISLEQKQTQQSQQQILSILDETLNTNQGKNFFKLATVRSQLPDLASRVTKTEKVKLTAENLKEIEKVVNKVKQSNDANAQFRADQFISTISKVAHKKIYKSDSDYSGYNSSTSGIPKIEQKISQPIANPKSANSTIAVNGSGFAGQKVIPEPAEIYNAVTGHVDVTQYKDEKERFAKEVYYKTRNLHPEVRKRAEAIMKKLQYHYKIKAERMKEGELLNDIYEESLGDIEKEQKDQLTNEYQTVEKNITQIKEKLEALKANKQMNNDSQKEYNELLNIYNDLNRKRHILTESLAKNRTQTMSNNPHVAAKERRPVQYPQFTTTAKQKEEIKQAGQVETLATQVQNQAMVSRFAKGLNDNPDAHTQNQNAQRDAGEVYNTSMKPDYQDLLPELKMIVEQQAQLEHTDPEQLQQALSVLDDKDPFEILFNLNFLNSKVAEVPITTKEQQRVRNEAEAIARKVGREQVFYPYNKREIELLQGSLSQYTNASGHVVPQPVRSKEYYEGLQRAEQKGVRKELENLRGVKKEETLKYLRQKQLEAEGSKGREKTKLNKEIAQLQKQLKELPDIKEGEEPQHGEVGIQQFVEFAHKLIKYVSKIEGDIDPTNNNLASYKTKTTVFTPVIKKKENAQFQFTTGSAFALRPC